MLGALLVTLVFIHLGHCQPNDRDASSGKDKRTKGKTGGGKATTAQPNLPTAKPKRRASPPPHQHSPAVTSSQPPPLAPPTGAQLTQVLDKGKFQRVGDSLTVPSGDTLELRCKGSRVQWKVPYYLEEEDDGRLKTVQHDRYGTLIVANATGADTGEYTCYPLYCEDTQCRREYDKAAKVFVFFPDPQELFVPSSDYYEVIQLRTNWPTRLPCQVTNPLAKVSLHREFPPEELKVDGAEISFHVMQGFTIHRPKPSHAGALYCVASLGNLRQSSVKYMLIYVNYPAAPPAPAIQASSSSVAVGSNLQVTCTVIGEQGVVVEFNWDFPGQTIGRPLYTEEHVETANIMGPLRQRSQSTLMVDEVREVDQGTYTCTAQNLQGSRSASTTVKVVPKTANTKKPKKP